MLEWYAVHGVTTVVVTPHLGMDSDDEWHARFDQSLQAVQELAISSGITVLSGAEMRLTPNIAEEHVRTIEGTDFALVDFPSGTWPFYADEAIFRLQTMGFRPILAHPERYGWEPGRLDLARTLVGRGVVLQLTLGSLSGLFGRTVREAAVDLLEAGVVHIVATDAHGCGARLETAGTSLSWLRREYGDEVADRLFRLNPSRILQGIDPEPVIVPRSFRRRVAKWIRKPTRKN